MNKLDKLKNTLQAVRIAHEMEFNQLSNKFDDSKEYSQKELDEAVTHGTILQSQIETMEAILDFLEKDDEEEKIKIKKMVKGFDAYRGEREFYVQVTKDEFGTSITIDNCTIPIEPLGIEIVKTEKTDKEKFIRDIDEKAKLYKGKIEDESYYILKVLEKGKYIDLFICEEEAGEPEGMINYYKSIKEDLKKWKLKNWKKNYQN